MRKIFHIGYQKTASTSLQQSLYDASEVYFIGKYLGKYIEDELKSSVWLGIRSSNELEFNPIPYMETIERHLSIARKNNYKSFVISEETLIIPGWNRCFSLSPVFERIKSLFGNDVEICIVIREQWSFLKSYYRQMLKGGLNCTFQIFLMLLYIRKDYSFLSYLKYDLVLDLCKKKLQSVKCFIYEEIGKEGEREYSKLFRNMG